ncbi:hypothetical protein K1719_005559 [Acacia pycnantha]|nr:hypothetical protein K1719_005559 [Acacia pycnantha]
MNVTMLKQAVVVSAVALYVTDSSMADHGPSLSSRDNYLRGKDCTWLCISPPSLDHRPISIFLDMASLKLAAQRKSNTLRRNRSSTIRAEYRHND